MIKKDTKRCSAIRFAIPNTPQDKAADANGMSVPNTLKIAVEHDDGGSSMWGGIRKRGIKVRFNEVETYPNQMFETSMIDFSNTHSCAFFAIALERHNLKRLQKVDAVIKANAETLAEAWFRGEREIIAQKIAQLIEGI